MGRPLAIDIFCGAGGASMGLHRAGFDVVGVDIRPQPRYPFAFVQGDALALPLDLLRADFIWASPPCQAYSLGSARWGKKWPDLVAPVREMLAAAEVPFVIENVVGAPIRADIVLVGPMFGLKTWRRRHFEVSGFFALQPPMPRPTGPKRDRSFVTLAGNGGDGRNHYATWAAAVEIDWMTKAELRQSIPPAYGEFIGRAALRFIEPGKAAA